MTSRNLAIVFSRCSRTRLGYCIRFERISEMVWSATWTFAVKESIAKKEGYQSTPLVGRFEIAPVFPGCPHCKDGQFFRCGCGSLGCWDGNLNPVTCPTCNNTGHLSGEITSLEGGSDL